MATTVPSVQSARDAAAIDWLLTRDEPGIRLQARRDLLGEPAHEDAGRVLNGPKVKALLADQQGDGGFGNHPYSKWTGAHWRLVSLVELGVPEGEPRSMAAYETVLAWLLGPGHRRGVPVIDGRARRCASQEGNALAVGVRLGMATDRRVQDLADWLIEWQWPDGGWNCDRHPEARHSSFNETVTPLGALAVYAQSTGGGDAAQAARQASELLLEHHIVRSHRTGEIGNPAWLELRYPSYWHYDSMQGLLMLARAGALPDPRASEALRLLRNAQKADGTWHLSGRPLWSVSGATHREAVPWERRGPSAMLTLNALRILRAAGVPSALAQ